MNQIMAGKDEIPGISLDPGVSQEGSVPLILLLFSASMRNPNLVYVSLGQFMSSNGYPKTTSRVLNRVLDKRSLLCDPVGI